MELAEANANILAVNTALDKAASSALQSHLLVQSLENKLYERVKCEPPKSAVAHSRGKRNAAEVDGAEKGRKETRPANHARHRTLRTCAFLPGCNDPRSATASNRHPCRELLEGQACSCYRPVDPCSGERVDCSSLVDEVTNQALHDEAQKIFASSKVRKAAGLSVGRTAVAEFREECRRAGGYPA
jgi:hypothetical protein